MDIESDRPASRSHPALGCADANIQGSRTRAPAPRSRTSREMRSRCFCFLRTRSMDKLKSSAVTRHTPFEELPEWLTVEEIQAHLATGRTATYDAVRSGRWRVLKAGRLIQI